MMHWKMLVVLHWNLFYHLLQLLPSYLWLCCEMLMLCWNISYNKAVVRVSSDYKILSLCHNDSYYELKYLCMHVCCYPYNGHLLTPSIFIEYVNLSKERKEGAKNFLWTSFPQSLFPVFIHSFQNVHEKVFHHHFQKIFTYIQTYACSSDAL